MNFGRYYISNERQYHETSHRLLLSVSVKYLIEMPTLLPQFLMKL